MGLTQNKLQQKVSHLHSLQERPSSDILKVSVSKVGGKGLYMLIYANQVVES